MSRGPDFKALIAQHGSPLLLLDCAVVRRQYKSLQAALPGVGLFYALKPLPHPAVVAELRDLGGCFDVATSGEIRLVRNAGIAAERCIHTHPIKTDAEIRAALRFGIRTFVVDNPDELRKFRKHRSRAEVLLRLSFRDPTAVVDLSRKFGCEPAAVAPMLELAQSLGVKVRGLSFHVGSQVAEARKYVEAIGVCAELITQAGASGLAELGLLDIGGGFPIAYGGTMQPIREFCRPIRQALAKLPRGIRVIAEPGRFIAGPSGTSIATVVGRAQREDAGGITSTMACTAPTADSCMTMPVIRSTCRDAGARPIPACSRVPPATASTSCARTFHCRSCRSAPWSSVA